ncbi:MAG: NADH-quinone oxidoreductase subunit C [Verrucomicrobiota bacterium]|nr:NADH-quinone oxidoreductase subunit C [Limisphaera sp.]MDW8381230.1 NADH-quinone oxidoreductase subunit C [Verrucomicrobiota bacterium]
MESTETIRLRILEAVPGALLEVVPNGAPVGQPSLLVDPEHALAVARFLRDAPGLQFDYCSNVTGVDWLDREEEEIVRDRVAETGGEKKIEEPRKRVRPGYLEVVYHLYSMALRHGPLVLRLRTGNRTDRVRLPSLTPIWRSCEFQEREVYDLFGVVFEGHPDLRRILMWEGFQDYPMRKDYVEPDDYEYEPTPHDDVWEKARRHYPAPTVGSGGETSGNPGS